MKKLNTLILSVALLCPMWAGAQTNSTPSILGPLHYSGSMMINGAQQLVAVSASDNQCLYITNLRLNIQAPNNASPIKGVSGYFTCADNVWAPFSGALIATSGDNIPNITNATTSGYTGNFTLGLAVMRCDFPSDLLSANCGLYLNFEYAQYLVNSARFTYTSAP
jgi:hypothetical protein